VFLQRNYSQPELKSVKQMILAWKQLFNRLLPFRSGTGSVASLFFCKILFVPLFLVSYHFCSEKLDCFVRLFLFGFVFALFCLQFDRRKLTAGLYKLHRLLQFTRAVLFSRLDGKPQDSQVGKKSCTACATAGIPE